MRQVPQHYLLIGDGRVARHFQHYFTLLGLSFDVWHRKQPSTLLPDKAARATHIIVLISDHAIDAFIQEQLSVYPAMKVHCSGYLHSQYAYGAHPLMTFSAGRLYDFTSYTSIPFVLDEHAPDFAILLPGLPNPHTRIPVALKAKYHALCALGGNLSCMLWQKLLSSFENELNLPATIAHPYLTRQFQNLIEDPHTALTGPLVRGDQQALSQHLAVLNGDPFQSVYQSFIECYQAMKQEKNK